MHARTHHNTPSTHSFRAVHTRWLSHRRHPAICASTWLSSRLVRWSALALVLCCFCGAHDLPPPRTLADFPRSFFSILADGGANFGIACAMYRTTSQPISFWNIRHNTIAGDLGVTIFIQGILTFLISSSLIHADVRKRVIAPFSAPWPAPRSYSSQLHRLDRVRVVFSGSSANDLFDFSVGARAWFGRAAWSVWQGAVISACYFCLVWPIAIAILAPRYGKANLVHTWVPPTIKAVYGAVFGLLQTPLIACIALGGEEAVRTGRISQETSKAEQMEEATVGQRPSAVEAPIAPLSPAHVV